MTDDLRARLTEWLRLRPLLVALDFDGVLAPIVEQPEDARALPGTVEMLERLAALDGVHVALVSGRALTSRSYKTRSASTLRTPSCVR